MSLELAQWLALLVAWGAALAFVVLYQARTKWWRWPMGRHVMAFMSIIVVLLGLGLARRLFGDYPGRGWVLLFFYCVFALLTIQRLVILWRTTHNPYDPTHADPAGVPARPSEPQEAPRGRP